MKRTLAAIGLVMALALAACGGSSDPGYVTAADLGDAWPLTVDAGTLHCYEGEMLTITAGAREYAINGTAKTHMNKSVLDIDEIWADAPGDLGLKIDIGPLMDRARALC